MKRLESHRKTAVTQKSVAPEAHAPQFHSMSPKEKTSVCQRFQPRTALLFGHSYMLDIQILLVAKDSLVSCSSVLFRLSIWLRPYNGNRQALVELRPTRCGFSIHDWYRRRGPRSLDIKDLWCWFVIEAKFSALFAARWWGFDVKDIDPSEASTEAWLLSITKETNETNGRKRLQQCVTVPQTSSWFLLVLSIKP